MNKLQKVLLTILTFISAVMIPMTAYAANGKCNINVKYSDGVTPDKSDKFEITIKDAKDNVQSFEIDAYSLANATGSIELPAGVYTVNDLTYKGEADLNWYGFSIQNYFIVSEDNSSKGIEIAVGYKQVKAMFDEIGEDSILLCQQNRKLPGLNLFLNNDDDPLDDHATERSGDEYDLYDGKIVGYEYEEGEIEEDPDLSEMAEMAVKKEEETGEPTTLESLETPTITTDEKDNITQTEKEKPQNKEAHKKSLLARVAILGMLVIIVGILLLVLKKKGKI